MKDKKGRHYIISISILVMLLIIATFGTEAGRNADIDEKLLLLFGLLFVSSMYLRIYMIYKLEKVQMKHVFPSFIDFFNNSIRERFDLIFLIIPYLERSDDEKSQVIKFQINFFTFLTYLFILASICLMIVLRNK